MALLSTSVPLYENGMISRIDHLKRPDLRCVNCECTEPCPIALAATDILHEEEEAHYRLGDVLDFSIPPSAVRELKTHIAMSLEGLTMHQAGELMAKIHILPAPSSFTLATSSGNNYAVIFVVGAEYLTHPVVVSRPG